jgi:hypothetical protein
MKKTLSLTLAATLALSLTLRAADAPAPAAAPDPDTALLLHFDDGAGRTAKDSGPNNLRATVTRAEWVEGRFGKALRFDGKDAFVDAGNPPALLFGKDTDFTVECWINVPADAPKEFQFVITSRLRGDEPGFSIYLHKNMFLQALVADKVNATELLTSKAALNDGKWHHVALVAERKGKLSLFIDGALQAAADMTRIVSPDNPNRPLRIGDRGHDGDFVGMIDEVRISRVARKEFSLDKPY